MAKIDFNEVTLNQIRSFVETARHGSFTAAAESLDLSQPTIWKQVHELERILGVTLLRTNRRGCELTPEGEILEKLAAPSIVNVLNLPNRFQAALQEALVPISIAASPRPLCEEIIPNIPPFLNRFPRARFSLLETQAEDIPKLVDDGKVELGFTLGSSNLHQKFPLLAIEPWYLLDVLLVLHKKHPLCRKKNIHLKDLSGYPLIGSRSMIDELPGSEQIHALGIDASQPRWVEARNSSVVRSCVQQQLGVALLLGREGTPSHPDLVEINMTPYLGQSTMYLVYREGVIHDPAVMEFARSVREAMASDQTPASPKSKHVIKRESC